VCVHALQTAATAITAVEAEESLAGNDFAGGLPPPPDEQPDMLADGYLAPPETNLAGGNAGSELSGGGLGAGSGCCGWVLRLQPPHILYDIVLGVPPETNLAGGDAGSVLSGGGLGAG
jgi:hypothetical protein